MLSKLSIALLIAASPVLAQEAEPVNSAEGASAEAPPVAYKTKKICRSIEVVGSSIPRTTCKTKKIPIEPKPEQSEESSDQAETGQEPAGGQ